MSNLREYQIDGRRAVFNKAVFQRLMREKSHQERTAISKLEPLIAEIVGVSSAAVHKWIYQGSGPSDVEMVKVLAAYFQLNDYTLLLNYSCEGGNNMKQLTDRQMIAAKRIYDVCIWFLHEFERSNGFTDYCMNFKSSGSQDPEGDTYNLIEEMVEKVNLALDQEYFDLRNCELYDELCEFATEELYDIFDGKLDPSCRYEAILNGTPSISEDYNRAMTQLNTIIEKYL